MAGSTTSTTVADAVDALLAQLDPEHGYLAVWPTSTGIATPTWPTVRATLAPRTERPVTFGWGPRFLHSTGQFHKGGPPTGVYLQVTGEPARGPRGPGPAVHASHGS